MRKVAFICVHNSCRSQMAEGYGKILLKGKYEVRSAGIEKHGLKLFGVLPHDEAVYRCDCQGEPSAKLPQDDPMKVALKGIMRSIGL